MKRFRSAFTLVELLIVIAIIGILMAILLPSLGAARAAAGRASCASNARQIVLAISNFASDNKDRLYNTISSMGSAPNAVHGTGNLNLLLGNKDDGVPSYTTRDARYDPAMPKDFKFHTVNSPTGEVSFYSVVPIGGLSGSATTTSSLIPKFQKFSEVPNDRALVIDILRYAATANHPTKTGTPYYNLAFRDGSVKTVQMPKEAYARWKGLGSHPTSGRSNNWFVHNDMIRILELSASGKDPKFAGFGNTTPWPFAADSPASTHRYIPLLGGATKEGRAHALRD